MNPILAAIRKYLSKTNDESETRLVAEYLDENWEPDEPDLAIRLCGYIADAANKIQVELAAAREGKNVGP